MMSFKIINLMNFIALSKTKTNFSGFKAILMAVPIQTYFQMLYVKLRLEIK